MSEDPTSGERSKVSRRGLLGAAVALPAGLAAPAVSSAERGVDSAKGHAKTATRHRAPGATTAEALEVLSAVEMAALEAFCARLVPSDALGPGAAEARAAHYIDRALGGPLGAYRDVYATGLSALDAHAGRTPGRRFAMLAAAEQDQVIADLEAGRLEGFEPSSGAFFRLVRGHTLEGMFGDPYYGGNADFIGWDLIGYPGLRMPVLPKDQGARKPEPMRMSAYSSAMFGRGRGT